MENLPSKEYLIDFEKMVAEEFEKGTIPYPIHYSGGNEDILIELFSEINRCDWVFSTWRSHYHYLLKGGESRFLLDQIKSGNSMHIMDNKLNFFASSIVGGCCPIAVGVAQAIKMNGGKEKVYVFVGDGGEDEGVFYESVRYAAAWELPILFVIEDNGLSVDTTIEQRLNNFHIDWPTEYVLRYHYQRKWPHCQTGKMVKEYM